MNHLTRTGADPVPLDFNTPSSTDTVADALVSQSRPPGGSRTPPESLLAEIGLTAHVARQVVAERSAPTLWE